MSIKANAGRLTYKRISRLSIAILFVLLAALAGGGKSSMAYFVPTIPMVRADPSHYGLPASSIEDISRRQPDSLLFANADGSKTLIITQAKLSLDSTNVYDVGIGSDDGHTRDVSVCVPFTTSAVIYSSTGASDVANAYIRWDTSDIPDTASVTAASYDPYVISTANTAARNFTGEWYSPSNWPITCANHTPPSGTDAFNVTIASLSTAARNTIALTTPSNVSKTGYTALRTGVSGIDSGTNSVSIASYESTSPNAPPQLSVTYTEMAVTSVDNTPIAANGNKSFQITGAVLTGTTSIRLEKTGEANINCTSIVVDDDSHVSFSCNLTGAADGAWNIRAIRPEGSAVGVGILDVHALAVTAVDPTSGPPSGSASLTIDGDGFDTGIQAALIKSGESNINCTSETITVALIELTADCDITGAAEGFWNLTLTNTDSTAVTLTNAFFVSAVVTLQAVGVSPGEHLVEIIGNTATGITLYLDGVPVDNYGAGLILVDNANDWELFADHSVPYVNSFEIVTDDVQTVYYQIQDLPGLTLTDMSGTGNDALALYPDTISSLSTSVGTVQAPLPSITQDQTGQVIGEAPAVDDFSSADSTSSGGFFIFDLIAQVASPQGFPYQAMSSMVALGLVILVAIVAAKIFQEALPTFLFIEIALLVFWRMHVLPGWMPLLMVMPGLFLLIWKKATP